MTETIAIDGPRALTLLREVVAEKGVDFVYQSPVGGQCVYANAGECSCLVGYALHRAGLPIEQLEGMGEASITSIPNSVRRPANLEITGLGIALFSAAQDVQDSGRPWGRALAEAEEVADTFGVVA